MRIGGFQKFSLIDYPGKISAIIFTQGCNFRCPYCHNPELVDATLFEKPIEEKEIFEFLDNRKGKLDAVSITGGEPTLHKDLPDFIYKIRSQGFLVKLDTNGTNPDMIEHLLKYNLVDYLAMDIKAPLNRYSDVTRVDVDVDKIAESIELIKNSGVDYEFRSTLVQGLHSYKEVVNMAVLIGKAKRFFLQNFVASKTLDGHFMQAHPFSEDALVNLSKIFNNNIGEFALR